MWSGDRVAQVRWMVDRRFMYVAAALVLVVATSGWLTYAAFANPAVEQDEEVVASWSTNGEFEHGATVQRDTSVFDAGTQLDNQPRYFTRVAPELNVAFTYWLANANAADVQVELSMRLVARSVEDDTELWRLERELDTATTNTAAPSDQHRVEGTVNVTELQEEVDAVRSELDATPGDVETAVVVTVDTNGGIEGQTVDQRQLYQLPIQVERATYQVDNPGRDTQAERIVEPGTSSGSPFHAVGPVALLVVSLGGLGALVQARRTGRLVPSSIDQSTLAVDRERNRFDDWITRGNLPEEVLNWPRIEVAALEDLVDLAIDHDRRVVVDENTNTFYVMDGDLLYVFDGESEN